MRKNSAKVVRETIMTSPPVESEAMSLLSSAAFQLAALASELTSDRHLLTEFLSLQVSHRTRETYAKSIDDFFNCLLGQKATTELVGQFLLFSQPQAVALARRYCSLLVAQGLAPATINLRLSALKSLVNYARSLEACQFSLADVKSVAVEIYRDTSGVDPSAMRAILDTCDRETTKGIRDYALLRLLWDNALRRGEIAATNVGDFVGGASVKENLVGRKLWIKGKGKIQKAAINLNPVTVAAIGAMLATRGAVNSSDPLFVSLDYRSGGHRLTGKSIYEVVNLRSKQAGISKQMSPHRVRHSAITAYLDASGGDVRSAQGLSRHKNLNTLTRYDDNRHQYQGKATDVLADLV